MSPTRQRRIEFKNQQRDAAKWQETVWSEIPPIVIGILNQELAEWGGRLTVRPASPARIVARLETGAAWRAWVLRIDGRVGAEIAAPGERQDLLCQNRRPAAELADVARSLHEVAGPVEGGGGTLNQPYALIQPPPRTRSPS